MSSIQDLKEIMTQINEPNEYELFSHDLEHPYYWIYKVENVRVKSIFSKLEPLRLFSARFDVFINGLFIANVDYIYDQIGNDFYIKFIRNNFPPVVLNSGVPGTPYELDETDEVKIKGDIEKFN
jgi:hypothetical protein